MLITASSHFPCCDAQDCSDIHVEICNSVVVPTVLCRNGSKFWLVKIRPLAGEVSIATMITGIFVCLAATILKARFCRMSFAMDYTCLIYVLYRFSMDPPQALHSVASPVVPSSRGDASRNLQGIGEVWRSLAPLSWGTLASFRKWIPRTTGNQRGADGNTDTIGWFFCGLVVFRGLLKCWIPSGHQALVSMLGGTLIQHPMTWMV